MATRDIIRFMVYFDEAGTLLKVEAIGDITTSDGYRLLRGYKRDASVLPAGFVQDMETAHDQIVAYLDTDEPA